MDDQTRSLIVRARQQDQAAIEELFARYRDRLHHAIGRLLGPRYRASIADSEDAVHDAILASLGRLDSFDYDVSGSFLAWLLRSADFQVRMRLRALATQKRGGNQVRSLEGVGVNQAAPVDTPSEVVAGQEEEERLLACMERLAPREREIILLRRYLALDMEEICQELDLPSPGAGRALLSRAQTHLAGMLANGETA